MAVSIPNPVEWLVVDGNLVSVGFCFIASLAPSNVVTWEQIYPGVVPFY